MPTMREQNTAAHMGSGNRPSGDRHSLNKDYLACPTLNALDPRL